MPCLRNILFYLFHLYQLGLGKSILKHWSKIRVLTVFRWETGSSNYKVTFKLLDKRSMHATWGPTRSVSSSSSFFISAFGSSSDGLKSSISTYHKSSLCYYEKKRIRKTHLQFLKWTIMAQFINKLTSSIAASCSRDLISSRIIWGGADSQPLASCAQNAYY